MSCPRCAHCQALAWEGERAEQRNQEYAKLDTIVAEAAEALDVEVPWIMAHTKALRPALARRLIWHAARELTSLSYPELARYFLFDHSSIIQGVKRVNDNPKHLQAAQNLAARIREKESL